MNLENLTSEYSQGENRFYFSVESSVFGKHFSASAKKFGNKVALVHGNESITFDDLEKRSNQLANYLLAKGLTRNSLVGVFYERNINYVILMIGIIKAGSTYVPVDPTYPSGRIEYIISNSGTSLILSSVNLKDKISHLECTIDVFDKDLSEIDASSAGYPSVKVEHNDLMYVVYTSGSTGSPKGVMIEHDSAINLAYAHQQRAYNPACNDGERKSCLITPFAFDVSIENILTLLFGHTIHIINSDTSLDPSALMDYIQENQINILCVSPSYIVQLIDAGFFEKGKSLSLTVLGGEMIGEKLWGILADSKHTFYNFYGPTEGTIDTSGIEISNKIIPNSVGNSLSNTNMYILDDELNHIKPGDIGEICISGMGIARGYINNPSLTNEKFIKNPYSIDVKDSRLYRTGDMGRYIENGNVEILGRKDNQVKIRGYRIELGEIEAVLKRHVDIEDASIVTKVLDDQSKRIFGYLILKNNSSITEISEYLKNKLPDYMIPMRLFEVENFPLTQNGKIDKVELMKNLNNFSIPPIQTRQERNVSPQDFIEKMWSEMFFEEKVPKDVSFFNLGGDSLLAMKVVSKCEKEFKVKLSIKEFSENPTIDLFSSHIVMKLSNSVDI